MIVRLQVILMALVLVLTACKAEQGKKHEERPLKVGVAKIDRGNIEEPHIMSGKLRYTANVLVAARVAAQVASIDVKDGQMVKESRVLLTLDQSQFKHLADAAQSDVQQYQAALEFNTTELERSRELRKTDAVSEIDYERKVSAYKKSLAEVEEGKALLGRAKQDLNWCTVRAPISGVLSERYVEKGDWVSKGRKLFKVSDYSQVYVKALLSDRGVAKLRTEKRGLPSIEGAVTVDAYPEQRFTGKISYIGAATKQQNLFEVRTYIDNPKRLLREGMFARVQTMLTREKDVLRVPIPALCGKIRNNEANAVYVVDKTNHLERRLIKIGANNIRYAEVAEGLKEGERVVVYGKRLISHGRLVEPGRLPSP